MCPVALNEDFVLEVETAVAGVYIPVADLNRYSKDRGADVSTFRVFNRATPHAVRGTPDETFEVSGFLNTDDAGQARLRAVEETQTTVNVRVLFDGANGFRQPVKVGSYSHSASADPGLQEITMRFTADGDRAIVGTGPLH